MIYLEIEKVIDIKSNHSFYFLTSHKFYNVFNHFLNFFIEYIVDLMIIFFHMTYLTYYIYKLILKKKFTILHFNHKN